MPESDLDNPLLRTLGIEMLEWRTDFAMFALPISPTNLNRSGVLHGGAIATLMDVCAGYCGLYSDGPRLHGVTLSLNVNFLNNDSGGRVIGKGFLERRGRSVYFSRAEAWLDDKVLLATAQGVFKYMTPRADTLPKSM